MLSESMHARLAQQGGVERMPNGTHHLFRFPPWTRRFVHASSAAFVVVWNDAKLRFRA